MDDVDVISAPTHNHPIPTRSSALTAPVSLNLVKVRTLVRALGLLGIEWLPATFAAERPAYEAGLYAWVPGGDYEHIDGLERPVLYIGVGRGIGGMHARLRVEIGLIGPSAEHVHGRAMFRLDAQPVGGPVHQIPGADLGWLDETVSEHGAEKLRGWLGEPKPDIVEKAEQICIRAAAHMGDTPPPVNSKHTTAWDSDAPGDWGGWAVAQRLAAEA
jgi:hypothetical protein